MEGTQQPPGSEPPATTPVIKEPSEENDGNAITSSPKKKRKDTEDAGGLPKVPRLDGTTDSDENATVLDAPVKTRTTEMPLEWGFTWDAISNFLVAIHKILKAAVFHFTGRSPLTADLGWTQSLSPRAVDLTKFCDPVVKHMPPELNAETITDGGSQYAWTVMKQSLRDVAHPPRYLQAQKPMTFLLDLAEGCRAVADVIGSRARDDIEKLINIAKQRHASMHAELIAAWSKYQKDVGDVAHILEPDVSDAVESALYDKMCDNHWELHRRRESKIRDRHSGKLDDDVLDFMGPDSNGDKHKREGKRNVLDDLRAGW